MSTMCRRHPRITLMEALDEYESTGEMLTSVSGVQFVKDLYSKVGELLLEPVTEPSSPPDLTGE